jgi:hypothetical protein
MLPLALPQQQEGMHCVRNYHMTREGHYIMTDELACEPGIMCAFP